MSPQRLQAPYLSGLGPQLLPLRPGTYPLPICTHTFKSMGPSQHNSHRLLCGLMTPIKLVLLPRTMAHSCYFMLCQGGQWARTVVLTESKMPRMLAAVHKGQDLPFR